VGRVGLVEGLDRSGRSDWYPRAGGAEANLSRPLRHRSSDFIDDTYAESFARLACAVELIVRGLTPDRSATKDWS
jgi:hypothetical protein